MDIEIEDPTEEVESDPAVRGKDAEDDTEKTSQETEAEELAEEEEDDEENSADPEAEDEVDKWRNLALRNQADLENYRKRMAREKSEAVQYANVSLLRSLLPILDSFEMGLQAAKAESEESMIYQGMAMVRKQIEEFISEEGVETIESVGADFDPNRHEAVKQDWSDEEPEGAIIGELRRGYRMGERLLRPANVVVSKGPRSDSEEEEAGSASED